MNIDTKQIKYVARLARIEISAEEEAMFTKQLHSILDYIAKLNELNTKGILPTSHVLTMKNVYRPDAVKPSLATHAALANAPKQSDDSFVVPKII